MCLATAFALRARFSCLCFALVLTGSREVRASPTLTIEFDHGIRALARGGKRVAAQIVGKLEIVDTGTGAALRSGPGFAYLQLPTEGIVSTREGTVEMWVSPFDWNGSENKFHVFFQVEGPSGAFYLYKYYLGNLLMLTCQDRRAGPYAGAGADTSSWRPGQWHHIAGTWSASHVRLYIDGKRVSETAPLLPIALEPTFTVGDHPWHVPRKSSSLIRSVRIYDRSLSDAEVSAHARSDYGKAPIRVDDFDLSYAVDPRNAAVAAIVEFAGEPADLRDGMTVFSLVDDQHVIRASARAQFQRNTSVGRLSLVRLSPGRYRLSVRISLRGRSPMTKTLMLEIPDTRWRANDLGELASVPPPWPPLRTRQLGHHQVVIEAYARQYEFEGSALPGRISAQGENLLAAPIRLVLRAAGRQLSRRSLQSFEVAQTTTATTIRSSELVGDANAAIRIDTRTRVEYDGLMVVDLEVVSPPGIRIDGAALDLSLRNAIARYRHRATHGGEGLSGAVPQGGEKDSFIPFAWIGDDQRGLFWFCETDENWPDRSTDDAYALSRNDRATSLRFTMADSNPLPARWRFRFGLQATPVKPDVPRLEPWRLSPAANSNVEVIWPMPQPDSLRYYGYPEPMNATKFQERVAAMHAKREAAVVYSCLTCLSTQAPEYRWFERDWRIHGGDVTSGDVLAYGGGLAAINPLSQSWGDFLVYKNIQLLETFGVDGFYHDNTILYPCTAGRDGCGYRDSTGRVHPTYPILAYRNLYRRLYIAVKERRPDSRLIAHSSGNIIVPILAYEDAYVDGETFRARVQRSYGDVLPLDQFRTEFVGAHFGVRSIFLPEFDTEQANELAPSRQLAALLLIHDVPAWPVWSKTSIFDLAYSTLDRCGATQRAFVPYYDSKPLAKVRGNQVYVSGYQQASSRSLLIVSNLSAEDQRARLELDRQRFGSGPLAASVVPGGAILAVHDGTIDVPLSSGDYRIIVVEPVRHLLPPATPDH